ncbi:hypothetical protein Q8G40_29820, partial [Klebsiella pneumoniae]|uniref:hypothetical protein n=1 Tax=Klebsiella pneumoniae TaxID=573 RepID=UPI003013C755
SDTKPMKFQPGKKTLSLKVSCAIGESPLSLHAHVELPALAPFVWVESSFLVHLGTQTGNFSVAFWIPNQ